MLRRVAAAPVVVSLVAAVGVVTLASTAAAAASPASPDAASVGTQAAGSAVLAGADAGLLPVVLAAVVLLGLGAGFAWYAGVLRPGETPGGTTTEEPAAVDSPETAREGESDAAAEPELSDEDRVLQLLEEHGGRMKQVHIVEQTDWSKSKVSMLLSEMEESDDISKLRVGRENIISLAGQEPEAAGSPFDEE
jgi:uncharacterized membrane protein